MNIQTRTCANCAQFNPQPWGDHPRCWALVTFTEKPGTTLEFVRAPVASDRCPEHQSHDEDAQETEFIESFNRVGGPSFACEAADACAAARIAILQAAQR